MRAVSTGFLGAAVFLAVFGMGPGPMSLHQFDVQAATYLLTGNEGIAITSDIGGYFGAGGAIRNSIIVFGVIGAGIWVYRIARRKFGSIVGDDK